ncbi:MAG: hypothetical protein ACRD3T_20970, partial [Terriglobia bacterium]
ALRVAQNGLDAYGRYSSANVPTWVKVEGIVLQAYADTAISYGLIGGAAAVGFGVGESADLAGGGLIGAAVCAGAASVAADTFLPHANDAIFNFVTGQGDYASH